MQKNNILADQSFLDGEERNFMRELERQAFFGKVEEDEQSYVEGPDKKQDTDKKKHRNPMSHLIPKKNKRK
jgi:hypothetical protein